MRVIGSMNIASTGWNRVVGPRSLVTALALVLAASLLGPTAAQNRTTRAPTDDDFVNPVLRSNFPDPFVLAVGDRYYAYSTNSRGLNVPLSVSDPGRITGWSDPREAMPVRPAWVRDPAGEKWPDIWAPEVIKLNERYVLYFSGRHERARTPTPAGDNRPCIGVATSKDPGGSFEPLGHPLICAEFEEGVIDPHPFKDDSSGKLYLYFKTDGNCCNGRVTEIMVQELTTDGLDLVGDPKALGVRNDAIWEGELIEAPTMIKRGSKYVLFYSANRFKTPDYTVGFARCERPDGGCTEDNNQLLVSSGTLIGPGHQALIEQDGKTYMAFHAWRTLPVPGQPECRAMHVAEVIWDAYDRPAVNPGAPLPPASWDCPP